MKTVNMNATADIREHTGTEYAIRINRRHVPNNDMFMKKSETSNTLRKNMLNFNEARRMRSCFCSAAYGKRNL